MNSTTTTADELKIPEKDRAKYRAFAESFGAALHTFDKASEWADLLKYLNKLQKVLDKNKQFGPVIPELLLLTRRMSQCLNPVLPGGLHTKALEVLDIVLERLGPEGIAQNLQLGMGVFPVFRSAPIAVRAQLLTLIEKRLLPLGPNLSPCLSALVLSLLPGIEEANGDSYPKVMQILDTLVATVGAPTFFSSLWLCLLRSPHVRLPALHFLRCRLPPTPIISDDPSWIADISRFLPDKQTLVLNALVQSLQDQKILVQRETLELIATHFQLRLCIFEPQQLRILVGAALLLLTRRESVLTRRLFSWLLGMESQSQQQQQQQQHLNKSLNQSQSYDISAEEYFAKYARIPLIGSIKDLFASNNIPNNSSLAISYILRPIKVLECLIDRDEIGSQIVDDIIGDSIAMLAYHRPDKSSSSSHEAVQNFLDTIDSNRLWSYLVGFSKEALLKLIDPTSPSSDLLQLSVSVLDTLAIPSSAEEVSELVSKHLPRLLEAISSTISEIFAKGTATDTVKVLQLALKIMGKIPQSINIPKSNQTSPIEEQQNSTNISNPTVPPPDPKAMGQSVINFGRLFCEFNAKKHVADTTNPPEVSSYDVLAFDLLTQILAEIHLRYSLEQSAETNTEWFSTLCSCCLSASASISCLSIRAFLALLVDRSSSSSSSSSSSTTTTTTNGRATLTLLAPQGGLSHQCQAIAHRLYQTLHHSLSSVHYESVGFLLTLEKIDPDAVHSEFAARMLKEPSISERSEAYKRFALLWRLSGETKAATELPRPFTRGLFLMLDSLSSEHPEIRLTGRSWLADSADKAERILDPLLLEALDQSTLRHDGVVYSSRYDIRRILYILRMLRVLFDSESGVFAERALQRLVSRDVLALNEMHTTASPDFLFIQVVHYVDLITVMCLRFIQGLLQDGSDAESIASNAVVQTTAAELLQRLLSRIGGASSLEGVRIASVIQSPILADIAQAVSSSNLVLQVHLLSLLRTMVQVDSQANSKRESSKQQQQHNLNFQHSDTSNPNSSNEYIPVIQSPMFLQTLIIGILQPPHKNLRCYWLDFLTAVLSLTTPGNDSRITLLRPILDTLCGIVESVEPSAVYDSLPANDISLILRTISFILNQELAAVNSLQSQTNLQQQSSEVAINQDGTMSPRISPMQQIQNQPSNQTSNNTANTTNNNNNLTPNVSNASTTSSPKTTTLSAPNNTESVITTTQMLMPGWMAFPGNLVGMLKDAFTSIGAIRITDHQQSVLLEKLPMIVKMLFHVYGASIASSSVQGSLVSSAPTSKIHNKYLLQDLVFHILDPIMQKYPVEVIKVLIPAWPNDIQRQKISLEIINTMEAATEETILASCHAILSSNRRKLPQQQQQQQQTNVDDRSVLEFLSAYIEQCVSPEGLCKAWPHFNASMKVAFSSPLWNGESSTLFLHIIHQYFTRVVSMEEKKGKKPSATDRKERLELCQKAVDLLLTMISQQQGNLPPPSPEPEPIDPQQQQQQQSSSSSSQTIQTITPITTASTSSSSSSSTTATTTTTTSTTTTMTTNQQSIPELNLSMVKSLGTKLLPVLDMLFDDKDKLIPILTGFVHALIPLTRLRWTPHSEAVVKFMVALCNYPYSIRSWRKDVWDCFHDSDFFSPSTVMNNEPDSNANASSLISLWTTVINHLFVNDKLAFPDLIKTIGKAMQVQQSIFTKEYEGMTRGKHLRRLSFVIFSGELDQYVRNLPSIKERVVEAFKVQNMPLLHWQAFLCIRVMFIKFSPQHLISFLPVVLTELMQVLSQQPSSRLESEVLLNACKLIDTIMLIPDPSLSINNWMFISEQRQHPRLGLYQPMLERLADSSSSETTNQNQHQQQTQAIPGKPLITVKSLGDADSISQLRKLLACYSDAMWNEQIASCQPDLQAISQLILLDLNYTPNVIIHQQTPSPIPVTENPHVIAYH